MWQYRTCGRGWRTPDGRRHGSFNSGNDLIPVHKSYLQCLIQFNACKKSVVQSCGLTKLAIYMVTSSHTHINGMSLKKLGRWLRVAAWLLEMPGYNSEEVRQEAIIKLHPPFLSIKNMYKSKCQEQACCELSDSGFDAIGHMHSKINTSGILIVTCV